MTLRWLAAATGFLSVLAILFFTAPAQADSWPAPQAWDQPSDNGRFVAHVTPAEWEFSPDRAKRTLKAKPRLEVFSLDGAKRVPLWQCELANTESPHAVCVSDDGQSVVALDEWGQLGRGDKVVVLYGPKGLLKQHSLESILKMTREQVWQSGISMSVSSIWWRKGSLGFFESRDGRRYYCLYIQAPAQWLAWNLDTGEQVDPTDDMKARWLDQGLKLARARLDPKPAAPVTDEDRQAAIALLGAGRRKEDRLLLEAQLKAGGFNIGYQYSTTTGQKVPDHCLIMMSSIERRLADEALACLTDGGPMKINVATNSPYHNLGTVLGHIRLSEKPAKVNGRVWLYLVPASVKPDRWREAEIVYRASFAPRRDDWPESRIVDFRWEGVSPGRYWIKAIWRPDAPAPPWGPPGSDDDFKPPVMLEDDFETDLQPGFDVKAGETVEPEPAGCTMRISPAPVAK
jgi:hypothetical protein